MHKKIVILVLTRKDNNFNYKNYVFKDIFDWLLAICHSPSALLFYYLAQNIGIWLYIAEAHFYDLVDVSLVVWYFDFQIVTCKARHHSATHRTLEKHLHFSAEIVLAEVVVATIA